MNKQLWKDALLWGTGLWFFGYILGIVLFFFVPPTFLGWIIMPLGVLATVWVLWKKIHARTFSYYAMLAVVWAVIAIVCDYVFLVQVFKPQDGYYKLDVYLYYACTALLPLIVGWKKSSVRS